MKYGLKSFQVNAPGTKEYADRWEQTFRVKPDENANYPGTITLTAPKQEWKAPQITTVTKLCLNCGAAMDVEGYCAVRCFLSST